MTRCNPQGAQHDERRKWCCGDVMHGTGWHEDEVADLDLLLHTIHRDDAKAVNDVDLLDGTTMGVCAAPLVGLMCCDTRPYQLATTEILVVRSLGDLVITPDGYSSATDVDATAEECIWRVDRGH